MVWVVLDGVNEWREKLFAGERGFDLRDAVDDIPDIGLGKFFVKQHVERGVPEMGRVGRGDGMLQVRLQLPPVGDHVTVIRVDRLPLCPDGLGKGGFGHRDALRVHHYCVEKWRPDALYGPQLLRNRCRSSKMI